MEKITEQMIKQKIEENKYRLLSQVEVSDDDYDTLINYTKSKVKYLYMQVLPKPDLMLSLALVQIAIRYYKEGRYWKCFLEEIDEEISTAKQNYLGQIFSKTLYTYGLFELNRETGDIQMYVENIKAHAFVTNYYMEGFYEFAYAYFENNLFRELSEDIEEDLEDLSAFMGYSLGINKDAISSEGGEKRAAKSYRLLKATRAVFAQCDIQTIKSVFYPVLLLIEKYYYDDAVPVLTSNRYEKGFIDWCNRKNAIEEVRKERGTTNRKAYSHRPFISVDVDREKSMLVIPAQKFRNEDCVGTANVCVALNGHVNTYELELYRSFGIYISEEIRIPILGVFNAIDISINTLSEKKYHIGESSYRIFNSAWESIPKFCKGHNYILVKPEINVTWLDEKDLLDYTDMYNQWQYFSAIINDASVCYIGNKPVSIMGEFSYEPIYEQLVEYFEVINKNGKKMCVSRSHPAVSFVVDKNKVRGTALIVNGNKYFVNDVLDKNCYDWPENKTKMAINVLLESLLPTRDGVYEIVLDVPGENSRIICDYLLLARFNCKFDKARYMYRSEACLTICKDKHNVYAIDEQWMCNFEDDDTVQYTIPLCAEFNHVEFNIELDEIYKIRIPVRMFLYGFSLTKMEHLKAEYIWYADLKENVYIKLPGAKKVWAYWGKERYNKSTGTEIADETFRIDISEFVRRIKKEERYRWQYINIEYEDNAIRHVALPPILRNLLVEPYFRLGCIDGEVYTELSIKGEANLFLKAVDSYAGNVIIDGLPIQSGRIVLPEMTTEGLYDLYPYMEEGDEFGFEVITTTLKPLKRIGAVNRSNLVNCRFSIKNVIFQEENLNLEYEYFINVVEKECENVYIGNMNCIKVENGRYDKESIKRLGRVRFVLYQNDEEMKATLQMYSYYDEEWMEPYYDRKGKSIISCDSNLLNKVTDYNRFVELDEDFTEYVINVEKLRRTR